MNKFESSQLNILSCASLQHLKSSTDKNTDFIFIDPSFFSHRNVVVMTASDEDLREFSPREFQNWMIQQFGGSVSRRMVGNKSIPYFSRYKRFRED